MWCLGTWFRGGLGSVWLTVRLDDFKGLFQPKLFYDSMNYFAKAWEAGKERDTCQTQM